MMLAGVTEDDVARLELALLRGGPTDLRREFIDSGKPMVFLREGDFVCAACPELGLSMQMARVPYAASYTLVDVYRTRDFVVLHIDTMRDSIPLILHDEQPFRALFVLCLQTFAWKRFELRTAKEFTSRFPSNALVSFAPDSVEVLDLASLHTSSYSFSLETRAQLGSKCSWWPVRTGDDRLLLVHCDCPFGPTRCVRKFKRDDDDDFVTERFHMDKDGVVVTERIEEEHLSEIKCPEVKGAESGCKGEGRDDDNRMPREYLEAMQAEFRLHESELGEVLQHWMLLELRLNETGVHLHSERSLTIPNPEFRNGFRYAALQKNGDLFLGNKQSELLFLQEDGVCRLFEPAFQGDHARCGFQGQWTVETCTGTGALHVKIDGVLTKTIEIPLPSGSSTLEKRWLAVHSAVKAPKTRLAALSDADLVAATRSSEALGRDRLLGAVVDLRKFVIEYLQEPGSVVLFYVKDGHVDALCPRQGLRVRLCAVPTRNITGTLRTEKFLVVQAQEEQLRERAMWVLCLGTLTWRSASVEPVWRRFTARYGANEVVAITHDAVGFWDLASLQFTKRKAGPALQDLVRTKVFSVILTADDSLRLLTAREPDECYRCRMQSWAEQAESDPEEEGPDCDEEAGPKEHPAEAEHRAESSKLYEDQSAVGDCHANWTMMMLECAELVEIENLTRVIRLPEPVAPSTGVLLLPGGDAALVGERDRPGLVAESTGHTRAVAYLSLDGEHEFLLQGRTLGQVHGFDEEGGCTLVLQDEPPVDLVLWPSKAGQR